MAASHILRIPRTDEEGSFILGEVIPSGSKPLNVKFVATEGEAPYVVKLRHDKIGDLKGSSSPCSPEEWESILKSLLLKGEPVEGIEAGAEVQTEKSMAITIRRRVAGINQRLGSITLSYKVDEGIELFNWCGAAILGREKFQESFLAETAKVTELEAQITALKTQLDELIQSKKERETELLEKFCVLLNEKKVKIREQQLLLSTSNVDHSKLATARAAQAQSSQEEPVHRKPAASRRTKRKALEDASGGGSSDSDDAFGTAPAVRAARDADEMDLDTPPPTTQPVKDEEVEVEEDRQTSDEDDDATGSEPDEDEEPVARPPTTRTGKKPVEKPAPKSAGKAVAHHPKPGHNLRNRTVTPPTPAEGSETESDDEL